MQPSRMTGRRNSLARPRQEDNSSVRSLLELMNKAFKEGRSLRYKPDLRQVPEGKTKIINSCPHLVSGKRNKKKTSQRKAKASGGQPGLPSKFQNSWGYTEKFCLEKL